MHDATRTPLIGITAGTAPVRPHDVLLEPAQSLFLPYAYFKQIWAAGGIPLVVPPGDPEHARECVSRIDGLLLSGGPDLDPVHFNEEPRPGTGRIDPERDLWELSLTKAALQAGMPILAICRGMQVLNVAAGGSICQDVDEQGVPRLKHFQEAPVWHPTHNVRVAIGSLLSKALGLKQGARLEINVRVNSFHHQAVNSVANGFETVGVAEDGVIEAMESRAHPFAIGVQWHPEFLRSEGLFAMFVEHAAQRGAIRENPTR